MAVEDTANALPVPAESMSYENLDEEIARVRDEIKELTRQHNVLTSTLHSSPQIRRLLQERLQPAHRGPTRIGSSASIDTTDLSPLLSQSSKQTLHAQKNLYRMLSGLTMFTVKDPDPYAVDDGHVLGVRIEAFLNRKFLTPYYLFLTKTSSSGEYEAEGGKPRLKIHKHTIPPCIPLAMLAAKYLPQTDSPQESEKVVRRQDLPRLCMELRKELTHYHQRIGGVENLRKGFSVGNTKASSNVQLQKQPAHGLKDISTTDAEGKDIRLEWFDGKVGRIRLDKTGNVMKCVVFGEEKRERAVERKLMEAKDIQSLSEQLRQIGG